MSLSVNANNIRNVVQSKLKLGNRNLNSACYTLKKLKLPSDFEDTALIRKIVNSTSNLSKEVSGVFGGLSEFLKNFEGAESANMRIGTRVVA